MTRVVLDVRDLSVEFATHGGTLHAVRGVGFQVKQGETLAIVGESGCGKSVTVQAVMGLIGMPPGRIVGGSAKLLGQELLGTSAQQLNRVRGSKVGMIFQDPMTSLNPTMKVGDQIAETLIVHRGLSRAEAFCSAVQLLEQMRVPDAAARAHQYPSELSGGTAQRAMIASSLACKPALLIADEPTTALDVTIQAQVLELMREIQRDTGMAVLLITHDLGVVARMADRVAVMYAGQIVECGSADDIYHRSAHPYTAGLKQALPRRRGRERLVPIPGSPPELLRPPPGCGYFQRCPHAMTLCETSAPELTASTNDHASRCWLQHPLAPNTESVHRLGGR
jgi:oligopeptide/dipeptide ABC transporter ATP-binding protein